jgi:hypothetical protein
MCAFKFSLFCLLTYNLQLFSDFFITIKKLLLILLLCAALNLCVNSSTGAKWLRVPVT